MQKWIKRYIVNAVCEALEHDIALSRERDERERQDSQSLKNVA